MRFQVLSSELVVIAQIKFRKRESKKKPREENLCPQILSLNFKLMCWSVFHLQLHAYKLFKY